MKPISSANKAAAIDDIIAVCKKIYPSEESMRILRSGLEKMNNEEFTAYLVRLQNEEDVIPLIVPNGKPPTLSLTRNLQVAKEIGHNFFQRLWLPDGNGGEYLTPNPCFIVQLPVRRMAQIISKKAQIPQDDKTIDDLTGQPTGASKGAKVSFPEVQTYTALGLDKTLLEFLKYRGGDEAGYRAFTGSIKANGGVSMDAIKHEAGGVTSVKTVSIYLTGMHLSNTL